MEAATRTFKQSKKTKHCTVFEEQARAGTPPIVGTIYVQSWFVGDAQEINVTIAPVNPNATPKA